MNLIESLLIAGLGMMAIGIGLHIWAQFRRRALDPETDPTRYGEAADPCMALFWGGMFTIQAGNVIDHVRDGLISHISNITWWSMAGDLVIVGIFLGRLVLRFEIRAYQRKLAQPRVSFEA
jgi:hypothetical protein